MANPRLPNITEAEQELLYEKLNVYNQGKASYKEAGCYLVVLPREGHPNYSLWFYTPLLDRQCILFIEDLKPDIIQSLRIVTSELWYANRQILVTDYNEKRMRRPWLRSRKMPIWSRYSSSKISRRRAAARSSAFLGAWMPRTACALAGIR